MHINGAARIADITDGTTNTMALVETPFKKNSTSYGPYWTTWVYTQAPNPVGNINRKTGCGGGGSGCPTAWGAGSAHDGGLHIGMADGSVRFLSENINSSIVSWLCNIADGNVISEF